MEAEELKQIVARHMHWINHDCDGWQAMRIDLNGTNLSGACLWRVDLRGAILRNVNLSGAILDNTDLGQANLYGANLSGAILTHANLEEAVLFSATLQDAHLRNAILKGANLRHARLSDANLYGANLSEADLHKACLGHACLRRANLCYADLTGADLDSVDLSETSLSGASLSDAKNVPFIPMVCPDHGAFTGWKKAQGCIVELLIPAEAKRSSGTGRKCRCSEALVVSIEDKKGIRHDDPEEGFSVHSSRDRTFIYRVGKTVRVDHFDPDRFKECTEGIHFFVNRQEAVNYVW